MNYSKVKPISTKINWEQSSKLVKASNAIYTIKKIGGK